MVMLSAPGLTKTVNITLAPVVNPEAVTCTRVPPVPTLGVRVTEPETVVTVVTAATSPGEAGEPANETKTRRVEAKRTANQIRSDRFFKASPRFLTVLAGTNLGHTSPFVTVCPLALLECI